MERKPYLYQHYTWPEMREVIKSQPVVILPIGSVEDHGPAFADRHRQFPDLVHL